MNDLHARAEQLVLASRRLSAVKLCAAIESTLREQIEACAKVAGCEEYAKDSTCAGAIRSHMQGVLAAIRGLKNG